MTTKSQLQSRIQELENELKSFKEQLNNFKEFRTIQDAAVGDTLEDGSIVVKKSDGLALLMAPATTVDNHRWSKEFGDAFSDIETKGFNRSQWFVPTTHQLQIAMKAVPDEFLSWGYWSSEEYCDRSSKVVSCFGIASLYKSAYKSVRLFRCVTY